jgi:Ras-related C3 botulinum toxin substrate 1
LLWKNYYASFIESSDVYAEIVKSHQDLIRNLIQTTNGYKEAIIHICSACRIKMRNCEFVVDNFIQSLPNSDGPTTCAEAILNMQLNPTEMRPIKIICVGDSAVGRTSMLVTHSSGVFPLNGVPSRVNSMTNILDQQPQVITTYEIVDKIDDMQVEYSCYDIPRVTKEIRLVLYPETDVFLLCFAVISPSSFGNIVRKWVKPLRRYAPHAVVILVGLKTDLRSNKRVMEQLLEKKMAPVTKTQGEALAARMRMAAYVECSALTGEGLERIFKLAVKAGLCIPARRGDAVCKCLMQ